MYLSKFDQDDEVKIGPIVDKEPTSTVIKLDEESRGLKMPNSSQNKLNEQINRFKAKDGKTANQDSTNVEKPGSQFPKTPFQNKSERISDQMDRPEKTIHKPESSVMEKQKDYTGKVNSSNYTNPEKPSSLLDNGLGDNFSRKRKAEEVINEQDTLKNLRENLSESVIPVSKRHFKRSKKEEKIEDNKNVNMAKARKRRNKQKRKHREREQDNPEEDSSDVDSESSSDTVTSTERDELLRNYFRKILCPILQEEREQSKKDTMDILENKGLIELASKKDLINFDNLQNNNLNKDPFLEDEGFAPSDISGATTPKKTPSSIFTQKSMERKDSFKLARTSQSQERKSFGTPKRTGSKIEIEKQIIMPNELTNVKESAQVEHKKLPPSVEPTSEPRKVVTVTKTNQEGDKVEQTKKTLFTNSPKTTPSIFSKEAKPSSATSLFNKPVETKKSEETKETEQTHESSEDKAEKPKVKSIFGPPEDTIEELRRSRNSNNSSPSFGESKNTPAAGDATTRNKPPQAKKTSLFASKPSVIAESPNEEDQANQEEQAKPAQKPSLFSSGPKPESKPAETTEKKPEEQKPEAPKPASSSNPFLAGTQKPPMNLFGKGSSSSEDKPKVSLFGSSSGAKPSNLFGAQSGSGAGTTSSSIFTKPAPAPTQESKPAPAGLFNQRSSNDAEDVGMGGTTPPTQSPIQQPAPMESKPVFSTGGSIFGNQGSGGSKPSGGLFGNSTGGSTFQGPFGGGMGNTSSGTSAPFSMGTTSQGKSIFGGIPSQSSSGNIFASGPSQGQPEQPKKSSWSSNPFGNRTRKDKQDDDGLFSDTKR